MAKGKPMGDLEALLSGGEPAEGDGLEEDIRREAAQSLIDAIQGGDVDAVLAAFDSLGGGMPPMEMEMEMEETDEG